MNKWNNNYVYTKIYQVGQSSLKPKILIFLILLLFGIFVYSNTILSFNNECKPTLLANNSISTDLDFKKYSIYTPNCKIQNFDPFSKEIQPFIKIPSKAPIVCNNGIPALFESDMTSIYLVNSSLAAYNVTNRKNLSCCYNVFWRNDVKYHHSDNNIVLSEDCYNITDRAEIDFDFIKVTCYYDNKLIYTDMFSFVSLKSINKLSHSQRPTPLNVLILGLDAVSRINLHRQMKKTVNYIKSIGAIELFGYNKVGDNTYPNLIPVLTGLNTTELSDTCLPNNRDNFDNCSFIWQDYKNKGYVTAYGEDASWMGLFNYERNGFMKQPTDYGYSYFSRFVEHEIGNNGFMNVRLCEGSRLVYRDFQEYIKKFVVTMHNNELPYFGFFWGVSLSHDDPNMPVLGDKDYYNFFKFFKEKGLFDDTFVIFLSDHGIRWGEFRQTYQGRMEERLPFVFMLLPERFKSNYPEAVKNLEINTRRLTTPFDLHETLVDLINPGSLSKHFDKIDDERGISLFREISINRTCDDAGIVSHWCTCYESVEVNVNSSIATKAASFALKYINNELDGYSQCAELIIDEIISARLMIENDQIESSSRFQDYFIILRTTPGNAVFEVTVRFNSDHSLNVIGTISRLNLYGYQSDCISDYHLKLYCYCKKYLN